MTVRFREAGTDDIAAVAALHADSWRRNYRGAYSDEFLDGDVDENRRAVWTERLTAAQTDRSTIVAEHDGVVVGFVHTVFDHDPEWGSFVDNLHVTHDRKRAGIGAQLMAESARAVLARATTPGLYLWVLEPNTAAQAFYTARGGAPAGREDRVSPAGDPVVALRYAWRDVAPLLRLP